VKPSFKLSKRSDSLKQPTQRIRLVRKVASALNGIDLSNFHVGDVPLVTDATEAMLIREGMGRMHQR